MGTKNKRNRRGIVLATVVVCLLLTVLLSAALATSALRRHRQLQRQARDVQAALLAESAVSRAAARLRSDPAYAGETWTVAAAELGGRDAGRVAIAVAAVEDEPAARRITIEAFYPDDPLERTRVVKTITLRTAGE